MMLQQLTKRVRALALGTVSTSAICLPAVARAQDFRPLPGSDGVYGRFHGQVTLSLGAGAELESNAARGALRLTAHYLWTAGVYARYADAFGESNERARRSAGLGIDVRPLFLPRFAMNYEQGPALLDLTLDSVSLALGGYVAEPPGASFAHERGFELGAGFGVPLLSRASGPWLFARAERRWPDDGSGVFVYSLFISLDHVVHSSHP
jgi:hypothetical protein